MNDQLFESLFKTYHHELGKYAMKYMRCTESSSDVVQNVFIRIWDKRDDLKDVTNWKSYLFFSVRNACIDVLRKRTNDIELVDDLMIEQDINQGASFLETGELENYIEQALKTLPKQCYAVFSLRRFEGLSTKQVAEELNISAKTVENQLTIALKKIKEHLAQFGLP